MKPAKKVSLAALAALMAMAFIGSTSAMAESTQLCKEDTVLLTGQLCPESKVINTLHTVTLGGEKAKFLTETLGTVECEALFLGNSTGLGAPLQLKGNFTYPNGTCKRGTENCTVAEVAGGEAVANLLKEGHETAKITFSFEIKITCGIWIVCTYDANGLQAIGKGPLLSTGLENGHWVLEEQELHRVRGVCPEKAFLDLNLHPLEKTYFAK